MVKTGDFRPHFCATRSWDLKAGSGAREMQDIVETCLCVASFAFTFWPLATPSNMRQLISLHAQRRWLCVQCQICFSLEGFDCSLAGMPQAPDFYVCVLQSRAPAQWLPWRWTWCLDKSIFTKIVGVTKAFRLRRHTLSRRMWRQGRPGLLCLGFNSKIMSTVQTLGLSH